MPKIEYIHRELEKILLKEIRQFPALVLTGPRQSGKSTLLKEILGKAYSLVSFDDPLLRERAISDPRLFLEEAGDKVAFDEIQYAPQLLSYIKILIDKNRHKRGRFVLTGPQQFNLIKNLGDTLAGRIALLNLLPFSLQEKEKISFLKHKLSNTQSHFIHACLRSSFPELSLHPQMNFEAWYGSYLQTYLERDVRTLYNVGSLREFQRFLQLLVTRCSQVLNLNSLASDLGVAVNTIKRWLSILEASQIIYFLMPYYRNLGKRITKSPKIYFLDSGLVCYLTGLRTKEHLLKGPLAGPLFENFCIQEIVKRFFNQGLRANLYYLRTHNGVEVDLIIEQKGTVFPLEIKLTKTPNRKMAEPIERFKKIFSKLDVRKGKIISLSEEEMLLSKDVSLQGLHSLLSELP
jgi:predicted AAA+ superfamily ATPase